MIPRNMIVSLRNNNSRWVYSIYLDAKGWIDIDLFAEDELAGTASLFEPFYDVRVTKNICY